MFGQTPTAQISTYTADQEEQDNRYIRFGRRELNLTSQLHNDQIQLANDGLENDIARLEGRPQNHTRILIDRFVIEQDRAAIEITNSLARVWYRSGNEALQPKLYDLEKQQFGEAEARCHPRIDNSGSAGNTKSVVFATLEEAKSSCADLNKIYLVASRYQISGEAVPSFFAKSSSDQTMGAKLLGDDTSQLKKDMSAPRPAKIKKQLVAYDEMLVDLDKQIWLTELTHESIVRHNNVHPEHAYKDVLDVIKMEIDLRHNLASISNEFRQKIADIDK